MTSIYNAVTSITLYHKIGLQSKSTTTWSTRGAYDLTCSTCKTLTRHCRGAWILSRMPRIFVETSPDQSFQLSRPEFLCNVLLVVQLRHVVLFFSVEQFKAVASLFEHIFRTKFLSFTFFGESLSLFSGFPSEHSMHWALCAYSFGLVVLFLVSTLPCIWRTPPEHFFRALQAVSQPGSDDGISPKLTRSAISFGQSCNG